MNAPEPLVRPLLAVLNRRLRAQTPALDLTRQMAGRRVAIRVRDTAIAVELTVEPDGFSAGSSGGDDPDLIVEGSLLALLSLGGDDALAAIRDGRVLLSGDAELADAFRKLFGYARPDFEGELADVVGDDTAQRIGTLARGIAGWGRERIAELGETLTKRASASGRLPGNDEFVEFADDVKALRDRTARLEARLRRLDRRD